MPTKDERPVLSVHASPGEPSRAIAAEYADISIADDLIIDVSQPTGTPVTNEELQHLNQLSGDAFVAEAARLGLVATDRGIFADPDHEVRSFVSPDDAANQIKDMFRRHGIEWSPEPVDTIVAGS